MRTVFADTGYWVALLNPRDELHDKATELSKSLDPVHIVTSEMVLTEVLDDFSKRGDYLRQAATESIAFKKILILPLFLKPANNFSKDWNYTKTVWIKIGV